ncbi:deoxynucleoside triphosphate triphosphohydrolase SAMHD1-like [Cheilinus undulatus]|uniref:deoxynucleoside triphosphate triphosphohydrolase SAMHD1-like n=1 Tax=Cheilinus undulatus TaxID=241271 RepID=UPI001BD2C7D5|nr:deoxynucleoside triphosphate triphosphohydrolase SAMHD1-like [Cheilinus undulatus]
MFQENRVQFKVFNDPIHGHIELHPLLVKIIDTPQFQRLRNIKQLGAVYFVYPGASHNRFEHSIGVAYLAGELVKALQTRQLELEINEKDILCVQIAGLCHDLGHGPFSHLYDQKFLPKAGRGEWKHEQGSIDMFNHMVKSNNLEPVMEELGLEPDDIVFIKEMINPPNEAQGQEWQYRGRKQDKAFLYDIVSNKRNGIDVDKFDYLARDAYHLGFQSNFDYHRFMKFARVCDVDGKKLICTRDKEVHNLYDLFHTRLCLHRRACQHKVNTILSVMIADAFLKAENVQEMQIQGSGGKEFTLSTAIKDMEAYTKLTDHVFEQILNSTSEELGEAREILQKIITRDFPKCVGEIRLQEPFQEDENFDSFVEAKTKEWQARLAEPIPEEPDELTADDFVILGNTMDYGNNTEDPVNNMYFYSKYNPNVAREISADQRSRIRTTIFSEHLIRVYCRRTDENSVLAAREHFARLDVADEVAEAQRLEKESTSSED